tara:strand:+ start:93 stop:494 length:402 start_codon:yes stop_codon:yes gene_type:complete
MQDPVSDLLTRIRNAQRAKIVNVKIPYSKQKSKILEVLKETGYIASFEENLPSGSNISKKTLDVVLKYYNGKPVIESLKRVSKPGLRVYTGYKDIPRVLNGLGIAILSTPKGVMTDKSARAHKQGGEIICFVA